MVTRFTNVGFLYFLKTTEVDQKFFKKDLRLSGHWDKFHITKLVRHWFQKPERNFGLKLEVIYKGENLVVFPKSPESAKHVS